MEKEHRSCGFSLIELLIAIVILAILMTLALPNLRDFIVANRLTSDVNSFVGLVNFARSEAITRNQSVVICPRTSPTDKTCASSEFWNKYEIQAFVDIDGNNERNTDDILLKLLPAIDPSGSQTAFTITSSVKKIIFGSSGFSQNPLSFDLHTVKSGDTAYVSKYGRTICISKPGRVRVVPYENGCTKF